MARVIRRILGGWVLGSGTETAGALACSAVLALPFTDAPDLHRCFSAEAASSTATKVCVVGGGPGGFYVTDKMFKRYGQSVHVSMIERLPFPFGLVRYGVAPDHPNTKNVINKFWETMGDAGRFSFFGNVEAGRDISLEELRKIFDVVVLTYGADSDRSLGIPGESLNGVYSAREFVNWYNGHPFFAKLPVDLSRVREVAVVGLGNVALDCARILLKSPSELVRTDLALHALQQLERSAVEKVHVVGRRGLLQASFTPIELKEITALKGVRAALRESDLALSDAEKEEAKSQRTKKRVHEILSKAAAAAPPSAPRQLSFDFLRSPREILGEDGRVRGLRVDVTKLDRSQGGAEPAAVPTGEIEEIPCQMVIKSIGYRSLPLEGLPFDSKRGVAINQSGRVLSSLGAPVTGLYVSGWLRRGATGIIGTNLIDAEEVVETIAGDIEAGAVQADSRRMGAAELAHVLSARGATWVDAEGAAAIDRAELGRPREPGAYPGRDKAFARERPREKIVSTKEMVQVAAAAAGLRKSKNQG